MLAVGFVLMSAAVLGGGNDNSATPVQPVAVETYKAYKDHEVQNLEDLIADFQWNQFRWMCCAPPGIDIFGWTQEAETTPMPFDPAKLPEGLISGLVPMDYGDYADAYFELSGMFESLFHRPVDLVTDKSLSNPYFIDSVNQTKTLICGSGD